MSRELDEAEALDRLRRRLAERAQDDGLLDVGWRRLDSPVGSLLLAATEAGLVRVAFAHEDEDDVLSELAREVSPRVLHAPARLDEVARELDEYFSRGRRRFDVQIDLRLAHGFRRTVVALLAEIGYGQTRTYAELAEAAGSPRAARAVGSACATNPLPLVLPCHRVLRSDGSLGGYSGGLDAKRLLLALEAVAGDGEAGRPGQGSRVLEVTVTGHGKQKGSGKRKGGGKPAGKHGRRK